MSLLAENVNTSKIFERRGLGDSPLDGQGKGNLCHRTVPPKEIGTHKARQADQSINRPKSPPAVGRYFAGSHSKKNTDTRSGNERYRQCSSKKKAHDSPA
jgi:hypothetical protein